MSSIPSSRWNDQVKPIDQRETAEAHPFWEQVKRLGNEMRSRQGELENLISGAATAQEAKNLKRRMSRRIVREGFPKITPFETIEQIERYIKGSPDGHTCLICGNAYRSVGIHLAKLHAIDPVDYLDAYGLPRTFGLACEETKQLHRDVLRETVESGNWQMMGSAEQAKLARKARSKASETQYKHKATVARSTKFQDADFWKIISLIKESGSTASEVLSANEGLPAYASFRKWKALDASRQKAFADAVDGLSFAKQAQMNMLGTRYDAELIRLRKENKTIDEISELVGVERVSINTRLKKLMPHHKQLKPAPKMHCPNGHEYKVRMDDKGRRFVHCQKCDADRKRGLRAEPGK